jgi:clan AA aspartic protease
MITGVVTASREATIRLRVRGPHGLEQEIDAVIDTGFNGWLSLPSRLITALGLVWLTRGRALLADGSEEEFDVYSGTVLWDGQPLRIPIDEAETDPLVGMSLLYGHELHIQVVDGGSVTIAALP